MPRSLCSCPLGVRVLKAPIGFKGPDQPQLEPPLTPLSMGPGAVFKLGLWPSVVWAALLGECWSGLALVIPALGYCAPWFGPWLQTSPWATAVLRTCLATPGTDPGTCGLTLSLHLRAVSSVNLSCDVDSQLDVVAVSGGFLLTLLRCCGAVPWLLFCSAPTLPILMAKDAATEAYSAGP